MIRLTRVRTERAIPAGFRGVQRIERTKELIAAFHAGAFKVQKSKFEFQAKVWKAAKKQLKKESAGKCAYCEAPVAAVAHGDVEHFRPKSVYWWLAYCYENYTYSCQICNQTFKGDQFLTHGPPMQVGDIKTPAKLNPDPLTEADGMAYADFEAACAGELAHLPDVYREDPEIFFKWKADPVKKEVKLAPRTNSARDQRAAAAAETVLGLNREELSGLRWSVYEELETYRDFLAKPRPDEKGLEAKVHRQIEDMMSDKGEFAGMVRYFVRHEWGLAL